jgi:hypothetical protein
VLPEDRLKNRLSFAVKSHVEVWISHSADDRKQLSPELFLLPVLDLALLFLYSG